MMSHSTSSSLPRRVLITGVSRGLGRAMADELIRLGHHVVGCARTSPAIAELRAAYGPPNRFDVVDVADADAVERWAETVLTAGPAPDFLLNNAALINRPAPVWDISAEEFLAVVNVNLIGVFHVVRAFVPAMIQRGQGMIVNFSSGWGRSTAADVAPYCTTKWGIEGFSAALADDLPPGLGAVALNPGIIATEMLDICFHGHTAGYPTPARWAVRAVPFILSLTPRDSGRPHTCP